MMIVSLSFTQLKHFLIFYLFKLASSDDDSDEDDDEDENSESEDDIDTEDYFGDDNLVEGVGLKSLIEDESTSKQTQVCRRRKIVFFFSRYNFNLHNNHFSR